MADIDAKTEAVARCLAKQDGRFISAVDWRGAVGDGYRICARQILATIARFDEGVRSGG